MHAEAVHDQEDADEAVLRRPWRQDALQVLHVSTSAMSAATGVGLCLHISSCCCMHSMPSL